MSFASNLKILMDERQISQAELAKLIGKGKSSVSQYVSGKNIPKLDVQEKIADALGCSVDYFFNDYEVKRCKKITVAECARMLGKSPQFVRVALQKGTAPFGFAVKIKSTYTYYISPKRLERYLEGGGTL